MTLTNNTVPSEPSADDVILVEGARVHNLKNISVTIPRDRLVVITGLSGSGKSSLAFDTIYAEGQRRYVETFSAYARQFLGNLERPDVDRITGLSPVISIEQKTVSKNPRSTVGTITEIYDFLRLLFARAAVAYSWASGEPMVKYTDDQIISLIESRYSNRRVYLLAPLVKSRKGHYRELFVQLRKKGYLNARIDGKVMEIKPGLRLDRYKNHDIEVVIDKLEIVGDEGHKRLRNSLRLAMEQGKGVSMVVDKDTDDFRYFSRHLMCPTTGISYDDPAPNTFSFNSPQGACHKCKGLGTVVEIDIEKIIPDPALSIEKGGLAPLGKHRNTLIFWQLDALAHKYGCTLKTPVGELPEDAISEILYGTDEPLHLRNTPLGVSSNLMLRFEGIVHFITAHQQHDDQISSREQRWAMQFSKHLVCPECEGSRLKKEARYFRLADKNISELANMDIDLLYQWLCKVEDRLDARQRKIAGEVLKEIRDRVSFLVDMGLEYLSLNRSAGSLSGGESQRIRLATQIGSQLVNVLYILDEPSIGLHQRDNMRLINSLKKLRDSGNSVLVVEHDKEMMLAADYLIDIGPHAGRHGGEIVAAGLPEAVVKSNSLTAEYLSGAKEIKVPATRRTDFSKWLRVKGASGNNLRNIDVDFPLGAFICVTGVSGSGKSTLVNETLHPWLSRHFYRSEAEVLPVQAIEGVEHLDKVVDIDQSPIGRTPRSNPATYTNVFTEIRNLFTELPESQIRGYKAGRFSFNVKGGRCEGCQGGGMKVIEMNFLPDVYVHCDDCNGKRYNRETLEVRYKAKSISDVLDMTINQAVEFFENVPRIVHKIKTLQMVGLGYLTLGQSSTTLSGGEAQRVKLAAELAKKDTGKTLYILDEPTTGLHFEDIRVLLDVLNKLVEKGNTVMVIEHNMDVIKVADYVIDMGPEGGRNGGQIVCVGTPEQVAGFPDSYTGVFLRKELNVKKISGKRK